MIVQAIKTKRVEPGDSLEAILDSSLKQLSEGQIVVISSKIIALCENQVRPIEGTDKVELIKQQSDYYLPETVGGDYIPLTIKGNTLIPAAGIDASNSAGQYVLWPNDPQASANQICKYLKERSALARVGVLITDSSAMPLHFGTLGVPIAYSGFWPFRNYPGQKDLFDFPLNAGKTNLAGGLAAAAVAVMGEGTEQTPLAIISEVPSIKFSETDPSAEELAAFFIEMSSDKLFSPFFKNLDWQKGDGGQG